MPTKSKTVRVVNAALAVKTTNDGDELIIRGTLDPDTLSCLETPDYQREILSDAKINKLMNVYRRGESPPAIEVNMQATRTRSCRTGCSSCTSRRSSSTDCSASRLVFASWPTTKSPRSPTSAWRSTWARTWRGSVADSRLSTSTGRSSRPTSTFAT